MTDEFWPQGKPVPAVGQVWRRKRNGRLVTVTHVPVQRYGEDVEYDMGNGKTGGTWTGNWHNAFELFDLEGATQMPQSNAYAADAGEFAARWNAMSPEMREEAVASIQSYSQISLRWIVGDDATSMAIAPSRLLAIPDTGAVMRIPDASVSQQITRLLGTDDWAILHSGHEMVTDVELDEIEAGK